MFWSHASTTFVLAMKILVVFLPVGGAMEHPKLSFLH